MTMTVCSMRLREAQCRQQTVNRKPCMKVKTTRLVRHHCVQHAPKRWVSVPVQRMHCMHARLADASKHWVQGCSIVHKNGMQHAPVKRALPS